MEELERELQQELARFDLIFNGEDELGGEEAVGDEGTFITPQRRPRESLSAYELAAAESEKEELQDKLKSLLSKTEDFDWQLRELSEENVALRSANEQLYQENIQLKSIIADRDQHFNSSSAGRENEQLDLEDFRLLEFKLAETRSKLARSQQLHEDMQLAREQALRELEHERLARAAMEKERDAYSAAYEASVEHFERWTHAKVKAKSRFSLSIV